MQAHATANRVVLYYIAESQASAAYLVDWDAWREAGVSTFPDRAPPGRATETLHIPTGQLGLAHAPPACIRRSRLVACS